MIFHGSLTSPVFLIVSLIIVVMIFNSNFQMGLIRENLLSADSKLIIFSLYVVTFILTGLILLSVNKPNLEPTLEGEKSDEFIQFPYSDIYYFISYA